MKRNSKSSPLQLLAVGLLLVLAAISRLLLAGDGGEALPADPTGAALIPSETSPVLTRTKLPGSSTRTPSAAPGPTRTPDGDGIPGKFDYFVLALSWSPDYCATSGGDDPQQCAVGRKLAFVLHGLWPQNNQGYPSNCSREPLPQSLKTRFAGLYPNDALFDHEWEKHGTCTGLAPEDFLALSKQFKEAVSIPAAYRQPETAFRTTSSQLRQEFVQANPSFAQASFEANCSGSGRYLKEVYVCFSRTGQPQACSAEVQKSARQSCQAPDFLVRNTR